VVLDQLFLKHFVLTQASPDGVKTLSMSVTTYGRRADNTVVWGQDHKIHIDDFDTWMVGKLVPTLGGVDAVVTAYAADKLASDSDTLTRSMASYQRGVGLICALSGVVGQITIE